MRLKLIAYVLVVFLIFCAVTYVFMGKSFSILFKVPGSGYLVALLAAGLILALFLSYKTGL